MKKVYAQDRGEGEVVVFLHGFCEDGSIWENIQKEISQIKRVVIPDLPGFGLSLSLPYSFSLDDIAVHLVDWLAGFNIEKFIPIGHSLGGYIALAMADLYPERVEKIVLFHSTALEDSHEKKGNRLKSIEFIRENGVKKFVSLLIPGLFSSANQHKLVSVINELVIKASKTEQETIISYTKAMMNRPDRIHLLKNYSIKKLFISGADDTAVPLESSIKQIEVMQNGRSIVLENVGHMGMYEAPKECTQLLAEFLLD